MICTLNQVNPEKWTFVWHFIVMFDRSEPFILLVVISDGEVRSSLFRFTVKLTRDQAQF